MNWQRIQKWYIDHGFIATVEDMREIRWEWDGDEAKLLRILQTYEAK